jgi:hypothetical protein
MQQRQAAALSRSMGYHGSIRPVYRHPSEDSNPARYYANVRNSHRWKTQRVPHFPEAALSTYYRRLRATVA